MAKDERLRNFACVVYPESAPTDWLETLKNLHIETLVSPLHDNDINPDGSTKKPHYHIMLLFEGKKSDKQVKEIFDLIGGVGNEKILSIRGYSRYLCHLDNPEKAQYLPEHVMALNGADYQKCIELVTDKYKCIIEMRQFICENNIYSYADLFDYCAENNFAWFRVLCDNGTVVIKEYLKSREWTAREKERKEILERSISH